MVEGTIERLSSTTTLTSNSLQNCTTLVVSCVWTGMCYACFKPQSYVQLHVVMSSHVLSMYVQGSEVAFASTYSNGCKHGKVDNS